MVLVPAWADEAGRSPSKNGVRGMRCIRFEMASSEAAGRATRLPSPGHWPIQTLAVRFVRTGWMPLSCAEGAGCDGTWSDGELGDPNTRGSTAQPRALWWLVGLFWCGMGKSLHSGSRTARPCLEIARAIETCALIDGAAAHFLKRSGPRKSLSAPSPARRTRATRRFDGSCRSARIFRWVDTKMVND